MTNPPSPTGNPLRHFARHAVCLLHLVALPAWAVETCGSDPVTAPNHSANYILGEVAGSGVAMHWQSGLVWQRCTVGNSGSDCSGDSAQTKYWNQWAQSLLPRSFSGQDSWWTTSLTYTPTPGYGPSGVDRLSSGAWRMPYLTELQTLADGCENGPRLNRNIFPNSPTAGFPTYWSASPVASNTSQAKGMLLDDGSPLDLYRANTLYLRQVRGGQAFASLADPAARSGNAGEPVSFDPLILFPSVTGTAWGGARITGGGSPQFQLNGSGPWLTEAVVQSGDSLTVRLTAGAPGELRTATLVLRSASTSATDNNGSNGGLEAATRQETQATFAVRVPNPPTVTQILLDPDTPTTLYAAVPGKGVFRRSGAGAAWVAPSAQPGDLSVNALAATGAGRLYAATLSGVWYSADHGNTWSPCGGQPLNPQLHSIVVDPAHGLLYVGGTGGVSVSPDACASWSPINDGLPN